MHLTILATAVGLIAAARFLHRVWLLLSSPLKTIPGPMLARFTDYWYFLRVGRGSFEKDNMALHRKYGEIVRYGPSRFSLDSPEAAKIIYGHGTQFAKSSWYDTWTSPGPDLWSIFSDRNISRHSQNRRQYQSAFSLTALVTYEAYVDECADVFDQRLVELAQAGCIIDMGHWFQCYAFDVIGLITYSKRLGFLDCGEDIGGVIAALEDHTRYASLLGIYSFLHPYIFPFRNWLSGAKGVGRAYVMNFTKARIAERRSTPDPLLPKLNGGTSADFLTKFLSKHTQDPEAFNMYHVLMGCTSNMVAGSDTTAISLSAVLYYLLRHPDVLQRLREEIGRRQEKEPMAKYVTFKEAQAMPYLQAVIKEALRMHPAVGLPLERVVPPGGAEICDRFFPMGSVVGINCWVMHRNPRVFGEDTDEFRPERWLTEDGEKAALMDRCWMPFGLGSRTCLGRHVSFLEICKLVPRLVRDFDFELDHDIQPPGQWETTNFWFVKPRDFRLKIKIRSR